MTKLPKQSLVVVVWMDAKVDGDLPISTETAWETHKPMEITTIGWVLRDDDIGISLANEFYDEVFRGRTFIPRGMVKSVTPHQLTKPRKAKAAGVTTGDQ